MKYLLLFLFLPVITSCNPYNNECKDTVRCLSNDVVWPTLVGFTQQEIDTIIVNHYRPGGNFSEKLSSSMYDSAMLMTPNSAGQAVTPWPRDTVGGEVHFFPDIRLVVSGNGDDVEMVIPGAGKTYRITDVVYDGAEMQEIEHPCYQQPHCSRMLLSYKVDGVGYNKPGRIVFKK